MDARPSDTLPPRLEAVPDEELAAVLAAAIRDGKAGTMTRAAEMFLAGVSADFLVDRLALAGFCVVRRAGAQDNRQAHPAAHSQSSGGR